MTFDERVQAIAKKGFTERQARFLTTVMLHTGICVPRQYARFCGIVYGAKTRKFFDKARRAVLRGARGVLRPSIQGAVPSLETGRRALSRQRGLPGDQRRGQRRRGAYRDSRARSPIRPSRPPGCRRVSERLSSSQLGALAPGRLGRSDVASICDSP